MRQIIIYLALLTLGTLNLNCTSDGDKSSSGSISAASKNPDNIDTLTAVQKKDEAFETFLLRFNSDETFQISRITFPLKAQNNNDDYQLQEEIFTKSAWHKLDFTYNTNSPTNEYKQTIKVTGDKAVIECRGIENGIMADYYFERKKGIWYLVTFTDAST